MTTLDDFILRDLVDRVNWLGRTIDTALPTNPDRDDQDDNVDRPPTIHSFDATVIVGEFLMRVRALPPSIQVDEHFVRLYRHLSRLPSTAKFDQQSLRLFAEEYSILTRISRLHLAQQEVTAAAHVLEVAREALDKATTKAQLAGSEADRDEVVMAKKTVGQAVVDLMGVAAKGAAMLNERKC